MTISEYSLKNRYTIYPLFIAAVVFGIISYFSLPIQLFPDTSPPLVNILTVYPGAAAEDVADLVSKPIEEEAASLEGVVEVKSTSQAGLSLVTIEFSYNRSVDLAAVDVQNAISRIRSRLPGAIAEPEVLTVSTSDRPVITLGLRGVNMSSIRNLAEDNISTELQRLDGVALVDVFGGYQPEIAVEVDRSSLEAHNLSIGTVVRALQTYNVSLPAGEIRSEGSQYSFRIDQQSKSVKELASIPLTTPAGRRILIGDLARINFGSGEDSSRFRVNGKDAIAMQIFKQEDANTVHVVKLVSTALDSIRQRYPSIEIEIADESASFTEQVVNNMLGAVGQALILATIIIFLFLGSLRRGFVVAVSMPMSFLLTFAGMKIFSIQVDMITLTAVILSVGMVVDASVVMLENITRHYQEGEGTLSPLEAALMGAKEIQFSIIAGNATTLAVLIPLLFLYGFVGKTFGPLAATMIIAFLSSLLVALTLVPILTMKVTNNGGKLERLAVYITQPWGKLMDRLKNVYVRALKWSLYHRWVVLILAFVSLVGGARLLISQGMELLPHMDGGDTFITIETPSGSSLAETERVVADAESIIRKESSLVQVSSQIGFEPGMHSFGGGGVQGPTQAYLTVTWTPRTERKESIWQIQNRLREELKRVPNIVTLVVRESGSTAVSTTASSIVVRLKGPDPYVLDQLGKQVINKVSDVPGSVNWYRNWRLDHKSINLKVNQDRARELGLSPVSLAQELAQSLDGVTAGVFRGDDGDDTPIRVRYAPEYRSDKNDVYSVRTFIPQSGTTLPVDTVVTGKESIVQGLVTRENLEPTLDLLALHEERPLNFVTADVAAVLEDIIVPTGYTISMAGEENDMKESKNELAGALAIAFITVYLLLVGQFKSFKHPVTVMIAIPLSVIGIAFALWVASMPVSMPVLVGLILLTGIVVNNSIIIIDFIQQRQEKGIELKTAIIESVETRFRPIMMTSLSTIVGMIPLAMEWALGSERFSPLAVAVIGGMTAATFLTMIVIPVFYSVMENFEVRIKTLMHK